FHLHISTTRNQHLPLLSISLFLLSSFFFNHPATTEIYTLSLHDALPISARRVHETAAAFDEHRGTAQDRGLLRSEFGERRYVLRSEEHTSELQSLAYLVCRLLLEKKKKNKLYEFLSFTFKPILFQSDSYS